MKISGVELTRVVEQGQAVDHLILRSDEDVSGVGEVAPPTGPHHVERSVVGLADLLVGRDPFEVEALLVEVKRSADGAIADAPLISAATSAMLDLAAKSLDVPMHQLIGGRVNDQVRACAVGWAEGVTSTEELVAAAVHTADAGFTVLRVEPIARRLPDGPVDLDAGIELVRAVRTALADEIDLVVACDGRLTPAAAMEFTATLRALEPRWIEEPVASWPPDPLRRVSARGGVPLAAGRGARLDILRALITDDVVDHLVVEVGRTGGVTEARRLAALAEVFHITVVPTGSGGAASLEAALQLAAAIPNLALVEVRPGLARVEGGMVSFDSPKVMA
jgi:galactonate dehydratase